MIHEMSIRSSFLASLALLAAAAAGLPLWSQEITVWRIGTFDHASAEFSGREGSQPVVVDAGAPDAARRWPPSQAGTLNARSGPQTHSRTIRFRLEEAPRGSYVLDLAIMAGNPRVPRLELELNGAQGTAYIGRRLSYHAEGRADSPISAEARERIPIPASALRQGDNELHITAVDDVADENGDSQIGWDALALLGAGQAAADPAISVEPAYWFVTENGAMRELLTVTVTTTAAVAKPSISENEGGRFEGDFGRIICGRANC